MIPTDREWEVIKRAVREVDANAAKWNRTRLPDPAPRDRAGGDASFWAKIVTAGPDSEADYSDARYWVREVENTGGTDPTDPLTLAFLDGGRWVTAHNLVELGIGTSDAGTHAIVKSLTGITVPDRFVLVRSVSGRYVFESYPGQMQETDYAFAADGGSGGCPTGTWYKMAGPGYVEQSSPGGI